MFHWTGTMILMFRHATGSALPLDLRFHDPDVPLAHQTLTDPDVPLYHWILHFRR
jgi:hypothetical protein